MTEDLRGAEASVVGAILLSREVAEEIRAILKPDDFSTWQMADVFAAEMALLAAGQPVDVITVADRLIEQGDIERIGGAAFLHQLTSAVTVPRSALFHAKIVKDQARIRAVREAATRIAEAAASGKADADGLAFWARDQISGVLDDIVEEAVPIGWHADDVAADLATPPRWIRTPWDDVNEYIGGWQPGSLYIVGARPSSGKSLMGLMAAAGMARKGNVALISLEMSAAQNIERLYANMGSIPLSHIVDRKMDQHDWEQLAQVRPKVGELPLFINDRSGSTVTDIRSYVRAVSRKGPLAGVVIDYLQLVSSANSGKPRWEAVGDISRELKQMARECDVPIIALSQLNRRTDHSVARPTLSDLRESGSLEQDADAVLLLQRVLDEDGVEYSDELEVIVAKNRSGRTGVATLFWQGHYARLSDMSQWR